VSVLQNFTWSANPAGDNVTNYEIIAGRVSGQYTSGFTDWGTALAGSFLVTDTGIWFFSETAQNAFGISPPALELSRSYSFAVMFPAARGAAG
jgi:hypothetical protein